MANAAENNNEEQPQTANSHSLVIQHADYLYSYAINRLNDEEQARFGTGNFSGCLKKAG